MSLKDYQKNTLNITLINRIQQYHDHMESSAEMQGWFKS